MNLMEVLFGKKVGDLERLAAQVDQMDELHKVLKESASELLEIRKTLVSKANGSLYPRLNAGIKLGDST